MKSITNKIEIIQHINKNHNQPYPLTIQIYWLFLSQQTQLDKKTDSSIFKAHYKATWLEKRPFSMAGSHEEAWAVQGSRFKKARRGTTQESSWKNKKPHGEKNKKPLPGVCHGGALWRRRRPTLPHCGAVPSARPGLTSLFGMGRGGTPGPKPPDCFFHGLLSCREARTERAMCAMRMLDLWRQKRETSIRHADEPANGCAFTAKLTGY